jgi:hypothetical protein
MSKRFTDTNLWDKEWFMSLSLKEKCLVKMVRDKADLSGLWSPNWLIASAYIGEKVSESDLLKIDNGQQFKKIKNGKIYCIGFIEFQYGELSEKSPVHKKIISILQQNDFLEDYRKPFPNRVCATLLNRVQEEEEEEDKEEEKEEEVLSELEKTFFDFLDMRKKIKKPATEKAKQLLLSKLEKLAPNNDDLKIQILEQSILNSWQDIYELKTDKNYNNGNTKNQPRKNDTIGGIEVSSLAKFSGASPDELSRFTANGG